MHSANLHIIEIYSPKLNSQLNLFQFEEQSPLAPSAFLPTISLHLQPVKTDCAKYHMKFIPIHCSCMVTNYEKTEIINQHPDIFSLKKLLIKRET